MSAATPNTMETMDDTAELQKWGIAMHGTVNMEHEVIGPFLSFSDAEEWMTTWLPGHPNAEVVAIQDPTDAEAYLLRRM